MCDCEDLRRIHRALYPGQPDARPSVADVCAEIEGLRHGHDEHTKMLCDAHVAAIERERANTAEVARAIVARLYAHADDLTRANRDLGNAALIAAVVNALPRLLAVARAAEVSVADYDAGVARDTGDAHRDLPGYMHRLRAALAALGAGS